MCDTIVHDKSNSCGSSQVSGGGLTQALLEVEILNGRKALGNDALCRLYHTL